MVDRRAFIAGAAAGLAGCAVTPRNEAPRGRILLGAIVEWKDAPLLKRLGYDYLERDVGSAFNPDKDEEWWKRQRDTILSLPVPLRACSGFIPGRYRLTGPEANHAPALAYAEKAMRRAEDVGVKAIVFGSGGARNVPGDYVRGSGKGPDVEEGARQYAAFCRQLAARTADLKTVQVVIEPLRPNESNIVNFVWQGAQICADVGSPRIALLADIFHMMMGREGADSIRAAARWLRHCHVAEFDTRRSPGTTPAYNERLRPYFQALADIGYAGGVSCECHWGPLNQLEQELETALKTMKGLIA